MNRLMITVSGLRGIIGESLTPQIASRYARAFARELPAGAILIARDSRPSGLMLSEAIGAELISVGRDVIDGGIAATPTVGVLLTETKAAGAIQISASHNPPSYNGMKLFGPDGAIIDSETGAQVKAHFDRDSESLNPESDSNTIRHIEDSHQAHFERVLAQVDVEAIVKCEFSVLLDSNHGAGGLLGRRLLERLGCQVEILGEAPTGDFAHPPEPTKDNLQDVGRRVLQQHAAVGFCQDPDADRLALIDSSGRYLGEEFTLALCLDHVLKQRSGPIVTNCSTSRMAVDLAARYGVPFHMSAVGEANVTAKMRSVGAVFGGEGNGGPIDPRVGYVRDSYVGMAMVLESMAREKCGVAELAERLPQYHIVKKKQKWEGGDLSNANDRLIAHFSSATANRLDGLRLDWPDRWLLVRASNTEPIIRFIAEAETESTAAELCDSAAAVMASSA